MTLLKTDIKKYKELKVISLDVFDTAIKRETFRPKDIFDIVESRYGRDFKEQRMLAEKQAKSETGGECSLDKIYEVLGRLVPAFKKDLQAIKEHEVSLELEYVKPIPEILNFYKEIRDEYKVVFISDMYLSRDIIGKMLQKAGYGVHEIYVSGEIGVNKANGGLFDYVAKRLGIECKEIFHIGDNYATDIISATKKGIKTYYFINNYDKSHTNPNILDKKIINFYNHKSFSTSFLVKILTEKENSDADIYNKIGFYWGIIFYEFVKWVVRESEGRKILFNSRDGFIPHKIAKCVMGVKNSTYALFSRRSSSFIAFDTDFPINHEKNLYFYNAFRFQRVNTVRQLLGCIGFDSKKVLDKIKMAGFSGDEDNIEPFKFNGEEIHEKTETLLQSIEPELYEHCSIKKQALLDYLDSINAQDNDIFCDIGYNGSIQYCIELMTGIKFDGKYFEIYDRKLKLDCEKEGFLSTGKNLTYGYGGLLETIFSAPHGGVVGYDCCEPLLFQDSGFRINILNKIHNGIIEFCLKWHELSGKRTLAVDREAIISMVMRFLKEPTLEESRYGLEVPFDNGAEDALENITWFNEDRIKNGRIIECYNRSYWKEAFLKILENSHYAGLSKFLPL